MGFFDFLEGIDDVASEYVGEKSLQQLYKSIATDSTTSSWAVKELKSRLRQMSNRELKMNIMKFVIVIAVKNFLIYLKVP